MTQIYACLAGNWVCLNDDPDCHIGEFNQSPSVWWEENAPIFAPESLLPNQFNSFYGLNYVHIYYQGDDWRINPSYIQIVNR